MRVCEILGTNVPMRPRFLGKVTDLSGMVYDIVKCGEE